MIRPRGKSSESIETSYVSNCSVMRVPICPFTVYLTVSFAQHVVTVELIGFGTLCNLNNTQSITRKYLSKKTNFKLRIKPSTY